MTSVANKKSSAGKSALALRRDPPTDRHETAIQKIGVGFRCDTETLGFKTPHGHGPAEIVVDTSEGFVPLWDKDVVLRWRFRSGTFHRFADPAAAEVKVQAIFAKALLAWGDAAPVKFAKRSDAWDFEIVMRQADDCDATGCVLASAFFPDAGQHKLLIYPKLFEQSEAEQLDTLAHEIGHVFGLRHFFALISETKWSAAVFGKHDKFTIMNYGADSKLTPADRSDLKKLYQLVWSGKLTEINGTKIRLMQPFHRSGLGGGAMAVAVAA